MQCQAELQQLIAVHADLYPPSPSPSTPQLHQTTETDASLLVLLSIAFVDTLPSNIEPVVRAFLPLAISKLTRTGIAAPNGRSPVFYCSTMTPPTLTIHPGRWEQPTVTQRSFVRTRMLNQIQPVPRVDITPQAVVRCYCSVQVFALFFISRRSQSNDLCQRCKSEFKNLDLSLD